ncbi:MAG: hypothetical protein JWP00_2651 [Chloroflexi bacterium]|jgi:hypothetical protein|nr:hypothetical protein [Chloroflexota bacterium]
MEISGNVPTRAEKQILFDTLLDFDNWKKAVPDLVTYQQVGDNSYEMTIKVNLGPVKGDQKLRIDFTSLERPDSANFQVQNSMIKSAKGNFVLQDVSELDGQLPGGGAIPQDIKTVILYSLQLDAGNPFFNSIIEGFKGQVKTGFEELLQQFGSAAEKA